MFSKRESKRAGSQSKYPQPLLKEAADIFQPVEKGILFHQNAQEQFHKISALRLPFSIALTRKKDIGPRSGRAGPSFSVRP
uniref:hypothetical protein n=1 Tax=Candidatus Fimivicinus sp. TaxID=3056640 RepID=UPI003FEFDA6B